MMTLIISSWFEPFKTAILLKFSLSCQMYTIIYLFMPATAQFETA